MDEDTLDRIFDPFFTTRAMGRGLGLAAVMGIVRAHEGAIRVTSTPGEGATFELLLPLAEDRGARPEAGPAESKRPKGGLVLVVDDEQYVRDIARRVLERAGYGVVTAADGREAVDAFSRHTGAIGCVILDMNMPRMNGRETLQELRKIREDVRVIVSSGYDETETAARFADQGLAGFIQKPYRPPALVERVAQIMHG